MYPKPLLVCLGITLAALTIQAVYLKSLPGSLVRVYYTGDIDDFNKHPAADMTVQYDSYVFDYRMPFCMGEKEAMELREIKGGRKPADMMVLIDLARWVRTKMTFGDNAETAGITDADRGLRPPSSRGAYRGLCDRYAQLFAAACQSVGIPARVIELDGHVVPEAFLREPGCWIMVDPTLGYYISRDGVPLSVAEIINAYRNDRQIETNVFASDRGDDGIYRKADEKCLKEIYLNGFTVVSNPHLNTSKILRCIAFTRSLPIAKLQYLDVNSVRMGKKESSLRAVVAFNMSIFALLLVIAAFKAVRRRPVT